MVFTYQTLDLWIKKLDNSHAHVEIFGPSGEWAESVVNFKPPKTVDLGYDIEGLGDELGKLLENPPALNIYSNLWENISKKPTQGLRIRLHIFDENPVGVEIANLHAKILELKKQLNGQMEEEEQDQTIDESKPISYASLPWEAMRVDGDFISLDERQVIIRAVDTGKPAVQIEQSPLKILKAIAQPENREGFWPVFQQEAGDAITKALNELEQPQVPLLLWSPAVFEDANQNLGETEACLFHFIGDTTYSLANREAVLRFVDRDGKVAKIGISEFASGLAKSIHIVFLNNIFNLDRNNSRIGLNDAPAKIAEKLLQVGVPVVITYNDDVLEPNEIEAFTLEFYKTLAIENSLEHAMYAGRRAMANLPSKKWVCPILFSRVLYEKNWGVETDSERIIQIKDLIERIEDQVKKIQARERLEEMKAVFPFGSSEDKKKFSENLEWITNTTEGQYEGLRNDANELVEQIEYQNRKLEAEAILREAEVIVQSGQEKGSTVFNNAIDRIRKIVNGQYKEQVDRGKNLIKKIESQSEKSRMEVELQNVTGTIRAGENGVSDKLTKIIEDSQEIIEAQERNKKKIVIYVSIGAAFLLAVSFVFWGKIWEPGMYIPIIGVPVSVLIWSFIGGTLAMITAFLKNKGENESELITQEWLISRPIIGMITGCLIYLLLAAGLLVINPSDGLNDLANTQNHYLLWALGAFGGWSNRFFELIFTNFVEKWFKHTDQAGRNTTAISQND